MFNNYFKDLFDFSKGQRKGIIVLLILLVIFILAQLIINNINFLPQEDFIGFDKLVEQCYSGSDESFTGTDTAGAGMYAGGFLVSTKVDLHEFNPNTAGRDELMKLGISEWAAGNLVKYREKGGVFYDREDLKKIYGLDDSLYRLLEPYIITGMSRSSPGPSSGTTAERATEMSYRARGGSSDSSEAGSFVRPATEGLPAVQLIEINSADSIQLLSLPGIGPVYAGRIIKYRKLLGGYYSIEQLNEVYGLKPETYNKLNILVCVDTLLLKKIDLNQATLWELKKHPYISDYQAEAIIKFREFRGKINSPGQLLSNKLVTAEGYMKIRPYFKVAQ